VVHDTGAGRDCTTTWDRVVTASTKVLAQSRGRGRRGVHAGWADFAAGKANSLGLAKGIWPTGIS
jgi:hypothetical protein